MNGIAIIWGILPVVLILGLLIHQARRRRAERRLRGLLKGYFEGASSIEQLAQGARESASRKYLYSSHFFALAVAAFQSAVNEQLTRPHSAENERRLMSRLAALKTTFGLADLYRSEGWRPGGE